jgi:hypothetical protein
MEFPIYYKIFKYTLNRNRAELFEILHLGTILHLRICTLLYYTTKVPHFCRALTMHFYKKKYATMSEKYLAIQNKITQQNKANMHCKNGRLLRQYYYL